MSGFDARLSEAAAGARNCAIGIADVKDGESVLVVMHSGSDLRIAQAIGMVCREVGAHVDTIIMEGPERGAEVTKSLLGAMAGADVIFGNALVPHTDARKLGARFVGLYMKDIEGLTSPGARLPAEIVFKICELATEQWKQGKSIKLTDSRGTNLTARITKPHYVFGHVSGPLKAGEFLNFAGGFGGLCLWPDWTANGVVFFDTVTTFAGRNRTPLKWTVEKGRVIKVDGDPDQVRFIETAIEQGGQDGNHFGEIMIGLCPNARIQFDSMFGGLYLETERHAGVMHCAVGSSTDLYDEAGRPKAPSVAPKVHLDCMNLAPTIVIDETVSVDRGRLMVVDHPEVQELARKHKVSLGGSNGMRLGV
jgi:hypothetical protein